MGVFTCERCGAEVKENCVKDLPLRDCAGGTGANPWHDWRGVVHVVTQVWDDGGTAVREVFTSRAIADAWVEGRDSGVTSEFDIARMPLR